MRRSIIFKWAIVLTGATVLGSGVGDGGLLQIGGTNIFDAEPPGIEKLPQVAGAVGKFVELTKSDPKAMQSAVNTAVAATEASIIRTYKYKFADHNDETIATF